MATSPARSNLLKYAAAAAIIAALTAAYIYVPSDVVAPEEETSLLGGRVVSAAGAPVPGVPVKAHRENSNITVSVYTDAQGQYAFPDWSEVTPGSYTVAIELPDFEPAKREGVDLADDRATQVDFSLQPRQPSIEDATASEIVAALPGTDEQKLLFSQCSNCHSLQWALRTPHTKDEWAALIVRMAGERDAAHDAPGSMTYGQKRFIEPLAEYLASIRGPGSSDTIPFTLRPRPTDAASTNLVVTEYDLPRGGARELYMLRGDHRFVWPHDVVVDANHAWYTDHFSNVFGRLDKKTGQVEELFYPLPPGGGRIADVAGQERAGNPGGGSHDLIFDSEGNPVIGMDKATVRYDVKAQKFSAWTSGNNMFGLDSANNVWHTDDGGPLFKLDLNSGKVTEYAIPTNGGVYDMDTDSKGRTIINIWRDGKIGLFDPNGDKYSEYPTPTPESGPRRGQIDSQDRLWVAEYYAGRLASFDPNTGEIREYPLIAGAAPFTAPYPAPYTTSVDEKNQWVWTTDFNSNRIYRFDMKTEQFTEFFMPGNYEVRDLTVEPGTQRPTLWIPAYRPPSKIVKVQVRSAATAGNALASVR